MAVGTRVVLMAEYKYKGMFNKTALQIFQIYQNTDVFVYYYADSMWHYMCF